MEKLSGWTFCLHLLRPFLGLVRNPDQKKRGAVEPLDQSGKLIVASDSSQHSSPEIYRIVVTILQKLARKEVSTFTCSWPKRHGPWAKTAIVGI